MFEMGAGHPKVILIMGVSGSGKTTVARLLAERLGGVFIDADDFHPPANVDKMSRGIPLEDSDRLPWLERLRSEIASPTPADKVKVLACSALRRSYREILGRNIPTAFLHGDCELLAARLSARQGHYMAPELLASQLATLEEPDPSEAIRFPITLAPEEIVSGIIGSFFLEV